MIISVGWAKSSFREYLKQANCVLMQSLMGETPKTALHRFLPTLQAASLY
ncbi:MULTISPECIES: hypothetical protein [unclassified Moorena]|nr:MULTISPECIES: hypothetical protein [unclassified Moorena]NEO15880.1 hypothetical protein [Moorena sp. SIO3E8]NEQ02297.1 hypothetical protein [Moorena sp. SIO3F7]